MFSMLDSRGIPTTWAVRAQQTPGVARLLVGTSVRHELAFVEMGGAVASSLPSFRQQLQLAQKVKLPLRTLVTTTSGLHPSLLSQYDLRAVVPLGRGAESRTGQLRGLAWSTWEAPSTNRVAVPCCESGVQQLHYRLDRVVRQSTRLHLVLELRFPMIRSELVTIESWLDRVADFAQRGWLRVETIGQQAAELAESLDAHLTGTSQAA